MKYKETNSVNHSCTVTEINSANHSCNNKGTVNANQICSNKYTTTANPICAGKDTSDHNDHKDSPSSETDFMHGFDSYGSIDEAIGKLQEMKKRKELLARHKYKIIFEEKRGYWMTTLPDSTKADGRRQIRCRTRKDLEDRILEYYRNADEAVNFKFIMDKYIDRKYELGNIQKSTVDRYRADAKRYLPELLDMSVLNLTPDYLRDFLERLVATEHPTPKAFSNVKTLIRGVLSFAKREKFISFGFNEVNEEILVNKKSFKKIKKDDAHDVFSAEEFYKLLAFLRGSDNPKDICLLLIALTGARVGEMSCARHCDFQKTSGGNVVFCVRQTQTRWIDDDGIYHYDVKDFPKTAAGVRDIPLPTDYSYLYDVIAKLNPNSEYVFLDRNGKPFSCNILNNRLHRICEKLSIVPKSPHKLRKTYASIGLDHGIDNNMATKLLGHTDILTTETYYHRNMKSLDKMCGIISEFEEFRIPGVEVCCQSS